MRTKVPAALLASAALLGGCYRMATPEETDRDVALTRATRQEPLDVVGPRVDPRTRTGAVERAGSISELAEGRAAASLYANEPERRRQDDQARGIGGSGPRQDD